MNCFMFSRAGTGLIPNCVGRKENADFPYNQYKVLLQL